MHGAHIRQDMEQDGVSGLMISRDALVLLGDDLRTLLLADADLDQRFINVRLDHIAAILLRGADGGLVHEVLQIRAGEARGGLRDLTEVHVLGQRLVPRMNLQDLLAALHVGLSNADLPVKTTRTHDGGVEDIHTVRRGHHDDALVRAETVHLHQQLVQGLLALVVAAAHTGAAASGDCVDLVNEHDAGRILLRLSEQVTDTRSADAHEHLDEIRTGDAEERHTALACDRLREQGLTGSGRAHQQHALRDAGAHAGELFGRLQELDDLRKGFLLFFQARDLREIIFGHVLGDLRLRLPEVHHGVRAGTALRAHHHAHHEEHADQDHADDDDQENAPAAARIRGDCLQRVIRVMFVQKVLYVIHIRNVHPVIGPVSDKRHDAGRHLCVLGNGDRLRGPFFDHRHELPVGALG